MSFYDKKTLVILSVLWYLVNSNVKEHRKRVLKGIEQVQFYYKINLKPKDWKWIRRHTKKFNIRFLELELKFSSYAILVLVFMIAEHYREFLKFPQRVVVWELLENQMIKFFISTREICNSDIELVNKFMELLLNDCLYLKN